MVESFEYMDALRALMLTSLTMFPFPHSICLPYQLLTPVPLLVELKPTVIAVSSSIAVKIDGTTAKKKLLMSSKRMYALVDCRLVVSMN